MGTGCSIPGPTAADFSLAGPNPVHVPAGQCVTVPVQITRPAGMTFLGAVSCFQMSMFNMETGLETLCCGTLIDRAQNAKAIGDFTTFLFGLAAIQVGLFAVKNMQVWRPQMDTFLATLGIA